MSQRGSHLVNNNVLLILRNCSLKWYNENSLQSFTTSQNSKDCKDCKGGSIIWIILQWISHCVVVPVGYAHEFVCLISCALSLVTGKKDYQNQIILYFKHC